MLLARRSYSCGTLSCVARYPSSTLCSEVNSRLQRQMLPQQAGYCRRRRLDDIRQWTCVRSQYVYLPSLSLFSVVTVISKSTCAVFCVSDGHTENLGRGGVVDLWKCGAQYR